MRHTIFAGMKKWLGLAIPVAFLVAGCAPSQQQIIAKDRLERVRTAYLQAKANPNVEAFAELPMADAGKALQAAEQAKNAEEMEQLAYVAEKKTQIAVAVAEMKMAERDADQLSRETSVLIAQKRTLEARIAQKEAEQARMLAQAEAEKAEKAKAEAERARAFAEARAREAEGARLIARDEAEKAERAKREAEQARLAALAEAGKAQRAKGETDQLMRELSDLKAKLTERGIVLTIGDVLFASGKFELSPQAMRSVDKLAEFLEKNPNRNVLIEGHTDNVGSDAFNLTLSQKRADSVKEMLVSKGIAEERITRKGYGKKYPAASNDTAAGKQENRRVEVIILNEGVKPEAQFRE